jgi:hypothetical protein
MFDVSLELGAWILELKNSSHKRDAEIPLPKLSGVVSFLQLPHKLLIR